VQSGQLPIGAIGVERYGFDALEAAIDAAEKAEGLTCVAVCMA
jgi:alcohol dehydrogenase